MSRVTIKPGVTFSVVAPGGFAILQALKTLSSAYDLVITSGTDGIHPAGGANDPHYRGEAYDVRSHVMSHEQQARFLSDMGRLLGDKFYLFLESPGEPNEHFHIQVRNGQRYTLEDLLTA